MDTAPLVDTRIEDGRKLISQLVCDGFDVTIAFWVRFKYEEDGPWFYIVSKTVDTEGLRGAFLAVRKSLDRISAPCRPWNSVTEAVELKIVGLNDHFAKDVVAFRDSSPGRYRFREVSIGNQIVKETVIYPPVTKCAAGAEPCGKRSINLGTAAEPEFIDLEKVPLVMIVRDSAGPSKVVIVGGGKPQRALEGEEAQRFVAQFDAIRKQME